MQGWCTDFTRLSTYVRDANDDPEFIQKLILELKDSSASEPSNNEPEEEKVRSEEPSVQSVQPLEPPTDRINGTEELKILLKNPRICPQVSDNLHRIVSQVMFGVFYRGLIYCTIPWDSPVMNYAAIIIPWGTAFGTYMVSNVGRQQSSFWWSLLGAYMGELFGAYIGVYFDAYIGEYFEACIDEFFGACIGEHFAGVLPSSKPFSAAAFSMMLSTYGWKWRNEKDNPSFRMCLLTVFMAYLILFCLCSSYFNINAAFQTTDGAIKVRFALDSSLNSPAWQDIKRGLWDLPEIIQQEWKTEAVWGILVNIINTVTEEYHAYNVLGLEPGAEFEEVRKKYKELAAKWHPDHHHGEKMKLTATEKFQQYANAYQLLKESHKRT